MPGEIHRTGVRDAQQVGDDRDGQRRGEAGHQVERPGRARRVQQVPGGALDPAGVARHRLRAEGRHREPAQPGVVRRVHLQERQAERVRVGRLAVGRGAGAEAPIAQDGVAHPVAGADPVAQPGRRQRAAGPEPPVDRVRVHPSRPQLEQGHRVAPEVAGPGDARPLPVKTGGEHDDLAELAQGCSVHAPGLRQPPIQAGGSGRPTGGTRTDAGRAGPEGQACLRRRTMRRWWRG